MGIEIVKPRTVIGVKKVKVFMLMETDIYSDGTLSIPRIVSCYGTDFDKKRVYVPKTITLNTENLKSLEEGEL